MSSNIQQSIPLFTGSTINEIILNESNVKSSKSRVKALVKCVEPKNRLYTLDIQSISPFSKLTEFRVIMDILHESLKQLHNNLGFSTKGVEYTKKIHQSDNGERTVVYINYANSEDIRLLKPIATTTINIPNSMANSPWRVSSFISRIYKINEKIYFKHTFTFKPCDKAIRTTLQSSKNLTKINLLKEISMMSEISPQSLFGMGSQMPDIGPISNLCREMESSLPEIKDSARVLNRFVKTISSTIDNETTQASAFSFQKLLGIPADSILNTSFLDMASTIFLLSSTAHLVVGVTSAKLKVLGLAIVLYVGVHKDDFSKLITQCVKWIREIDFSKPEVQSANDYEDKICPDTVFERISNFLSLAFSSFMKTPKGFSKDFVYYVSSFPRFTIGITSIFTWISDVFVGFLSWAKLVDYIPSSYRYMFENNDEVLKLAQETDQIHNECIASTFAFSSENQCRITDLLKRMKELKSTMRNLTPGKLSTLNFEITYLTKLSEKLGNAGIDANGCRPEPSVLLMGGKPGQFKSQFIDYFLAAIANSVLDQEELELFQTNKGAIVHNMTPENGYWDGYTPKHKFCIADDFGQTRDVAGNPDNEYMKFIRAVNEIPYNLHVAELENKGRTYFNSHYIIATTNQNHFSPNSIYSSDALTRRMHTCVWVELTDDYSILENKNGVIHRKLDISKLPVDSFGRTIIPTNAVKFTLWEPTSVPDERFGEVLTFDQVVQRVISIRKKHVDNFQSKIGMLHNIGCLYRDHDSSANERASFLDNLHTGYPEVDLDMRLLEELDKLAPGPEDYGEVKCTVEIPSVILETNVTIEKRDPDRYQDVMLSLATFYRFAKGKIIHATALFSIMLQRFKKKFLSAFYCAEEEIEKYFLSFHEFIHSYEFPQPALTWVSIKTKFHNFAVTKTDILVDVFGKGMRHMQAYAGFYSLVSGILVLTGYGITQAVSQNTDCVPCDMEGCASHMCDDYIIKNEQDQWIVNKLFKFSDHNKCGYSLNTLKIKNSSKLTIDDWEKFFKKVDLDARPQYKLKKKSKVATVTNLSKIQKATLQAGEDKNGDEIMNSVVQNNSYRMSWVPHKCEEVPTNISIDNTNLLGTLTFVKDRLAIVPRHFVNILNAYLHDDTSEVNLDSTVILHKNTRDGFIFYRKFTFDKILRSNMLFCNEFMEARDLVAVLFDKTQVQLHRDITHYLPTRKESFQATNFTGVLRGFSPLGLTSRVVHVVGCDNVEIMYSTLECSDSFVLETPFHYRAGTEAGDCGSLLFRMDPNSRKKFFGIHVAGKSIMRNGYSARICLEDIEDISLHIGDLCSDTTIEFQACTTDIDLPASFSQLCDVSETERMNYPNKTQIVPSSLHGQWPMLDLSPTNLSREAYRIAISKYSRPPIHIDDDLFYIISKSTFSYIVTRSTKYDATKRLLTWEETINGINSEPNFGPVDRSTSPGYPFIFRKDGLPGKLKWLGNSQDPLPEAGKLLISSCESMELKMRNRERCFVIYTDNLKDEKRPIEKVMLKKTRLFSGCPLDYLLLVRKYFGMFSLWIIKNNVDNGIAVGINPYQEWHPLAMQLLKHSGPGDEGFLAGDFSGFDCAGKQHIYWHILHRINDWYDDCEENKIIRTMLWVELVQSRHIHKNHIYEWTSSLPSGHPLTVLVNSIYNLMAFRYCWFKANHSNITSLELFDDNVYLITFGDDVNGSVSPRFRTVFNDMVIQDYMRDLDLTYTSDDKGPFLKPLRTLKNISFLKRSYIINPMDGQYIGALDKMVIYTTPGWTRKKNSDQIAIDNYKFSLRESSIWGREFFQEFLDTTLEKFRCTFPGVPINTSYLACISSVADLEYYY